MMTAASSQVDTEEQLLERNVHDTTLTNPKKIPISTRYGCILVTQQGPSDRAPIVTYHDVGYNSATQFHHFFAYTEMMPITEHFTVYHINAPGQEDEAYPFPATATYPTMDQLVEAVDDVFIELNIKSAIGFGIGLGANILARFALRYSSKICGLILVNCISRSVGWLEGLSLKWTTKDTSEQRWTESLMNYLIRYHLGPETQASHPDLVNMLRRHLEEDVNAGNVIKLLNVFLKRNAIPMERASHLNKKSNSSKILKCSVLNVTGSTSPHKDDVIDTNDRCDSAMSSYVEFADCGGAVVDEQPAKLAESIRLFLQGLGYMSHLSIPRFSTANRLAEQVADYKRQHGSFSRVPRRLSSQIDPRDYQPDEFEEDFQLRVESLNDRHTNF